MRFSGRGVLLDIEGTTSSIRFVYDEMFPFVLRELDSFLKTHFSDEDVAEACEQIAQDAGRVSFADWRKEAGAHSDEASIALLAEEVRRLMEGDVKATGLKQLQGILWKDGFASGELKAHVYPDVRGAIADWRDAGLDVRIYSSGSVQAQHLFFGHTEEGDMLPLFNGHYDTKICSKKHADSYRSIASEFGLPTQQILFVSDNVDELEAANEAGMATALCERPGNPEPPPHSHPVVTTFEDLHIEWLAAVK